MSTEHIPAARVTAKANEDRTAIVLIIEPGGQPLSFSIRPEDAEPLIAGLDNAYRLCRAKAAVRPARGQRLIT